MTSTIAIANKDTAPSSTCSPVEVTLLCRFKWRRSAAGAAGSATASAFWPLQEALARVPHDDITRASWRRSHGPSTWLPATDPARAARMTAKYLDASLAAAVTQRVQAIVPSATPLAPHLGAWCIPATQYGVMPQHQQCFHLCLAPDCDVAALVDALVTVLQLRCHRGTCHVYAWQHGAMPPRAATGAAPAGGKVRWVRFQGNKPRSTWRVRTREFAGLEKEVQACLLLHVARAPSTLALFRAALEATVDRCLRSLFVRDAVALGVLPSLKVGSQEAEATDAKAVTAPRRRELHALLEACAEARDTAALHAVTKWAVAVPYGEMLLQDAMSDIPRKRSAYEEPSFAEWEKRAWLSRHLP